MIELKRLGRSFRFALRGLAGVIRKEQNFRVHVIAGLVAVFAGFYFNIFLWQWCLIILMIASVMILELLNTAFERLVDMFKPRLHEYAGEIKDMMSAMVLIAALASLIIGLIIFIPHIIEEVNTIIAQCQ
jgi:diacylglycerol kinase